MNLRPLGALALASAAILLVVDLAPAAVVCVSPHGLVRVREKCKRKDTPADPAALGLQVPGPQGPTGPLGIPGAVGATGTVTVFEVDDPFETTIVVVAVAIAYGTRQLI